MTTPEPADPLFETLVTERLLVRAPVIEDLDAIVARRNDPAVAEYQDWTLPHPREKSKAALERAVAQGGLVDDKPWMATVALRETNQPIGDLYTKITWGWRAAEVGYSFDSAHWGQGYAGEAFTAMLNHLFDDRGIVRASATLHPDNIASCQLLERAGFTFEGKTKQSFWVGDEISDDGFYGLTKADRDAWLSRPTGPPTQVTLVEVTRDNYHQLSRLVTHKSQERLVSPIVHSFADALFPELIDGHPVAPRMWGIEADGDLAGFIMIADVTEHHPDPYLWRLLIDRRFQRRGIGERALELVETFCRDRGDTTMFTSWAEGRGTPEPFYLRCGYTRTGQFPDGEVEGSKSLI